MFKRSLSLGIRQSGNERIQTLKGCDAAAAGAITGQQYEQPVAGDTPLLDDAQVRALLAGTGPHLAPVFEVHVKRHHWNFSHGDAAIEVALDLGKVIAADREAPFCEIALHQKAGPRTALFALARQVSLITPARLGVLSKAERGYRLLGPAPGAVKMNPIPLTPDMSAATALAGVAAVCLRQFRLNEMALNWSRDAEVVHQARVSLRRLRSLFSICKSLFQDIWFAHMREELRWLAGELGDARNIDVMIERATSEALLTRLHKARANAYGAGEASLSSVRARSLMIEVSERISTNDWETDGTKQALREQPSRDFASGALDKLWKKVAKGGRNLINSDDETRHELRIAAKKLRYTAEFFKPLYNGKTEDNRYRLSDCT